MRKPADPPAPGNEPWFLGRPTRLGRNLTVLLLEALRSGTIASLAIVPLGWLFRTLDLRVGHYGPKFAALYIDSPLPWQLFVQHMVVGWFSAVPLLLALALTRAMWQPLLAGASYGAGFYVVINSLALPLYFGDSTPWQLGWPTVWPSLIGHIAYGACVGYTAGRRAVSAWTGPSLEIKPT